MPDSTQDANKTLLTTLAIAGGVLVVALILPLLADMSGAVQAVIYLVGAGGALAVVYFRQPRGGGGAAKADIGGFCLRLAEGDIDGATSLAQEQGILGPEVQASLDVLRERSSGGADTGALRTQLEGMGIEVTSLTEALSQQLGATDELTTAGSQGVDLQRQNLATVEEMATIAEESSSNIMQIGAINNEVRENLNNLTTSVEGTTTAIEEMAFSSKEVAKNIEELSTAAEETAASMNQMDVSISQVETNANETSKLSEQVSVDAETGVAAINHTIQGIDRIKESSRVAAEVITNLGQKIGQIGNILNVIDDVAEQTNLLALNAAIIAAQAGEHGRGFAVVADEIKALAERTGASTKEIAGLIKTIQDESARAVEVMSRGVEDVEEGVRLGHNAEDALRKIVESAKRSTLMIQAIAQATVEQSKGSKQVTNAISRIAETVQQIAYATAEQAKGSEHIMQSAERMKIITKQVERSADEQGRGSGQLTNSIESIREHSSSLEQAQRSALASGETLAQAANAIRSAADQSLATAHELERSLGELVAALD